MDAVRRQVLRLAGTAAIAAAARGASTQAPSPLRIGFGMALTGGLAVNGKPALLAMQIWQEDVNAKGGLLGRKVEFVYFDDQSNPASVPGLYAKLLDVDKVDLIVSGYATNMVAPLMPTAIERRLLVLGLFSLASNAEFHYPNYFSMLPVGPQPKLELSRGFFEIAQAQEPKPRTVAMISADAEFSHRAAEGARENATAAGLKIIYDRTYPPSNVDFGPILRGVQAANANIVYVASYPSDSVGIVRAANEIRLTARQFGGSLVGLQSTTLRMQLGPLLNGIVASDYWVPTPALMFPGIAEFLAKYQARAAGAGVDPLGYFIPPFAYARMQVLAQAIEATGSIDQGRLADYLRRNVLHTIVGDFAFGADGEWSKPRYLFIQYRDIKDNSLEQFRQAGTYVVLHPREYNSGATAISYDKLR
jgi:branched-chain amino acid transport system substrate-binding protein